MSPQLLKIEEQALLLPPEDRELLVERLLRSLRSEPAEDVVDPAWIAEADRRYREVKEGKVEAISGDHLFAEIRQELGWQS